MVLSLTQIKRSFTRIVFFILLVNLAACTSTWKAPVHSYPNNSQLQTQTYRDSSPINSTWYRVRKGDTLYAIAWRTGRDYQNLARWNRLSAPYTIYVGQVLRTRPPTKTTVTASQKPPKAVAQNTAKKATTKVTPVVTKKEIFKKSLRWRWPTNGKVIKGFRKDDDTRKGIVLSGKVGQSILSAEQGKVVYSGSGLIGYGQLIIIKHNNNYLSAYGHNRKILVKEGDWVTKGKKIAEMGMNDTGVPALHFEIRKNGNPLNPVAVLPGRK